MLTCDRWFRGMYNNIWHGYGKSDNINNGDYNTDRFVYTTSFTVWHKYNIRSYKNYGYSNKRYMEWKIKIETD